ncbi:MAG: lasso peptide biosynthesis B2 protein [Candidatus Omnitrophica bacterium]|nr:lasso peptide biosynthesis B2 protein [Candidatus Omnitrophota bacterium]
MKDIALFFNILYYVLILPFWLYKKDLPEVLRLMTPRAVNKEYSPKKVIFYGLFWTSLRIPTFFNHCLRRSLVLFRFLREAGVEVTIIIGVQINKKGRLKGHSWLMHNGRPFLNEPSVADRFKVIYAYPGRPELNADLV